MNMTATAGNDLNQKEALRRILLLWAIHKQRAGWQYPEYQQNHSNKHMENAQSHGH